MYKRVLCGCHNNMTIMIIMIKKISSLSSLVYTKCFCSVCCSNICYNYEVHTHTHNNTIVTCCVSNAASVMTTANKNL